MYRSFFGLSTHPFRNTADPRFFFKTASHEEALAAMLYGVTQRQGMTLVTGKTGTGKTLLAHLLVQALGSQADAVILPHLPETGHELLTTLCRSFGIRYRQSHSTSELIDRLKAHLLTRHNEGLYALVILDEAEHMTPEVMEHVRLLSDLEYDSIKVPQLVLLARSELCGQLMQPAHEQFRQRIACARELEFLERDQTHGYVRYRLRQAGCDREDLFTEDALDYIHEQSGGSPRLINQLADAALLSAYSVSSHIIDREMAAESVRGLMAVNLAMTPESIAGTPPVPSGENADRHLAAASSVAESIHEATCRGTEVLGRLDEVAKHALERVGLLTQLLSRSESQAQSVAHAEQALEQTSHAADERVQELHRRVEEARSLIVGLKATRARIKRWQKHGIDQMRKQSKAQRAVRHELDLHMQSAQSASGELVDQVARANEAMNAIDQRVEQGQQEVARWIERVNRLASDLEARQLGGEECERQLRQLMEELTERATQLDELSETVAQQTGALQELLKRSGQSGEALQLKAEQIDEQFQQTLDRRVAEGRERITDLITRMDARGQQLLEVLDTSRTLLDQLGHQDTEAEKRAAHLRTLLDEACRQIRELQNATAGATEDKQELTSLLARSEESAEALEERARWVIQHVQDELTTTENSVQNLLDDVRSQQQALAQTLGEIDTALAQWRKSEASRRQSDEEIEAMLTRLEEGQSCSQHLVDEMTAATASLKPLLEGAHETLDALRQQQDHWQEAHQAVEASCDTVKGLMTSADSLQGALASLCQDALGARSELASRLEELALRRREHDALLDRQRELEGAVASQIKQCRRASWEIESSVRDANVASGQVSTRAHELAGRMNRAEELIAALDARLLRAEKITQQFRQVHDELARESREATHATRQLRVERLRAEGVLHRLSRAPDTYVEDDSDEEAREVPALRLRLSGRFDRRHGDDTDDPSDETSTSEATFRGAAS